MRQLKYRIPILILLFAAALAGFFYRSQKTGDASGQAVRTALETPRLPVIWAESCGKRIDVMRGLRAASAEDPAADTLIILPEDRNLTLDIEDGSLQIRGVRYEVRSSDGKDLIERKDVQETSKTERGLSAVLPVENIVRAGSEYQLEIILTTAEMGDVYYYARITMDETGRAAEMLALAEEFSAKAVIVALGASHRQLGLDREESEDLAVRLSSEIAEKMKPYVDGYYLITPFSRTGLIRRIIAEIKAHQNPG